MAQVKQKGKRIAKEVWDQKLYPFRALCLSSLLPSNF